MRASSSAESRARHLIDALLAATAAATATVSAGLILALARPGEWTHVVVFVDAILLITAAFVLLFGWSLRRALERSDRAPWAAMAVWSLLGVLPVVGFAIAQGLKVLRTLT